MSNEFYIILLILGIPCLTIASCFFILMYFMKATTGELKVWLTPENMFKIISIIFILNTMLVLTFLEKISGEMAGTIISGITGYALSYRFSEKKEDEKK